MFMLETLQFWLRRLFDTSVDTGQICIGLEADKPENYRKMSI